METPDCINGTAYDPEACERALVAERNAAAPRCACGDHLRYRHGVGGYSCRYGSLYRSGGMVAVRECSRVSA